MLKFLFGVSTFIYGCLLYGQYSEIKVRENTIPIEQKYQKSYFRRVLPYKRFQQIHKQAPKTASFILSLDPQYSRVAWVRWTAIIFIGWFHFCFLSRWGKKFPRGVSKKFIFSLPIVLIVLGALLKLAQIGLNHYSPPLGKYFVYIVGGFLMALFAVMTIISLFSIPVSLILGGFSMLRLTVCHTWIFGEKVFGTPNFGLPLKFSNYADSILQLQKEIKSEKIKNEPVLPGPIVKKRMIDGVWYND